MRNDLSAHTKTHTDANTLQSKLQVQIGRRGRWRRGGGGVGWRRLKWKSRADQYCQRFSSLHSPLNCHAPSKQLNALPHHSLSPFLPLPHLIPLSLFLCVWVSSFHSHVASVTSNQRKFSVQICRASLSFILISDTEISLHCDNCDFDPWKCTRLSHKCVFVIIKTLGVVFLCYSTICALHLSRLEQTIKKVLTRPRVLLCLPNTCTKHISLSETGFLHTNYRTNSWKMILYRGSNVSESTHL